MFKKWTRWFSDVFAVFLPRFCNKVIEECIFNSYCEANCKRYEELFLNRDKRKIDSIIKLSKQGKYEKIS